MTARETTDGFSVATDALVRIRALLTDTTETHRRERDAEGLRAPGPRIDSYRPGSHTAVQPLPAWHAELNRRWQDHHAALVAAQEQAAHNLAFNVRSYLECEAAVIVLIRDGAVPGGLGRVPESGFGGDVLAPAGADQAASIADLDHAVAVWRRRRDIAADTGSRLDNTIDDSEWTGPTSDAFHDWVHTHLRRWDQLRRAADTVVHALTDPVRHDDPYDRGPDIPDLTDRPPASGLPDPATAPPLRPPDRDEGTRANWDRANWDRDDRAPDARDGDDTVAAAPDDPVSAGTDARPVLPPVETVAEHAPDTDPAEQFPADDATAEGALAQATSADPSDMSPSPVAGELVPGQVTSAREPGPSSTAPTPVPPGEGAPLPTVTGPQPGHYGTSPSDPPEPMSPPMLPAAAVAGATALARADRAYYVVREIAVPPDPTRPTPPPPPRTTEPVLSPLDRFRTAHPPATPGGASAGPGWPLPPDRHDPTSPLGPGLAPGVAAPTSRSSSAPSRRGADRVPMWVNLQPTTAGGAWIDLAATPGLGLSGPDPGPVVRTVLHELHLHTTTMLIVPRDLLDDLTDPLGSVPASARVHIVDDPFDGLDALTRHILGDHHDHHGDARGPGDLPDACLLVARAPRSTAARDELARTLAALHPARAGALLLGSWPHGATLHLDDDHRVTGHHSADPGADLTGHRLHPTGPDQLADALRPRPPAHLVTATVPAPRTAAHDHIDPEHDTHDHRDHDHRDHAEQDHAAQDHQSRDRDVSDRDVREEAERQAQTALTLSVFGSVELRYRPTDPPEHTTPATGAIGEDARVPITRLPRLARALLAYLATEPTGFTREHLIETLCPGSRAQRADGPLQTALSRLRSRIADVTGDKTHDDIIVTDGTRWMLNPATVTADTWALFTAFTPRAADYSPEQRHRDLHAAVAVYRGLFDTDLSGRWAHEFRETASIHYRNIIHDLAEIEIRRGDDTTALLLLERARETEQTNEGIYRSIIKIQLRNGRTDEARATFALLRSQLAAIDATPEPETHRLISGHAP